MLIVVLGGCGIGIGVTVRRSRRSRRRQRRHDPQLRAGRETGTGYPFDPRF